MVTPEAGRFEAVGALTRRSEPEVLRTLVRHAQCALLLLFLSGTAGCGTKDTASRSASSAPNLAPSLPPSGVVSGGSAEDEDLDLPSVGDGEELDAARAYDADHLQSEAEDLAWEIRKLRRNADQYSDDEFATRLRRLETQAGDLSSEAGSIDAGEAERHLGDLEWDLRKTRRAVEDDPRYYYREREDEIDSDLRRREWEADDAASTLDDVDDE